MIDASELSQQSKLAQSRGRVAIVVQRYGDEVNGGAEVHAKMIALRLRQYVDVTVLTTCAKEYLDWQPYYQSGECIVDGVRLIRFENKARDEQAQRKVSRSIKYSWPVLWRRLLFSKVKKWVPYQKLNQFLTESGVHWLEAQGPYTPKLKSYIEQESDSFDVFIFCTSLYYTTAACLPSVAVKSILVPHLHEETPSVFPIYHDLFRLARHVICNTNVELQLAEAMYGGIERKGLVAGPGVDLGLDDSCEEFQELSDEVYLLYLGRVSNSKGCDVLFKNFQRFVSETGSPLKLYVAGGLGMDMPIHPQISYLGFVDESHKKALLANARVLIIPSQYESLSLVLLESFAKQIPVLVNEHCEVLRQHILESKGGLVFSNYATFEHELALLLSDSGLRRRLGEAGLKYVQKNYSWELFDQKYLKVLSSFKNMKYLSQNMKLKKELITYG